MRRRSTKLLICMVSIFLIECSVIDSPTRMQGEKGSVLDLKEEALEKGQLPPIPFNILEKYANVKVSPDKVDILLVRDNSGSMESEQSGSGLNTVIEHIGYLLDKLSEYEDIDYRIAITSTTSQSVLPHHRENGTWKYDEEYSALKSKEPINPNNSACITTLFQGGKSTENSKTPKLYFSLDDYVSDSAQTISDLKDSLSAKNIEAQDGSVFAVEEGLLSALEALNLVNKNTAKVVWDSYSNYQSILASRPFKKITEDSEDIEDFFDAFDKEYPCTRTKDWYRDDAKLAIIFFSDEDHCSFNTQIAQSGDGIEGRYSFGCMPYNYADGTGYGRYWNSTGYTYKEEGRGSLLSVFGPAFYTQDNVKKNTLYYRHHSRSLTRYSVGMEQQAAASINYLSTSGLLVNDSMLKELFYDIATEYEKNCHNMGKNMFYINYKGGVHTTDPIYPKDIIPGLKRYIGTRSDISIEPSGSNYTGCPQCDGEQNCTVSSDQRIKSMSDYESKYDLSKSYINAVPPKERCIAGESHTTDIRFGKAMCTYVKARYGKTQKNEKYWYRLPQNGQLTSYDIGMVGRDDSKNVFIEYLKTLKGSLDDVRVYGALNLDPDLFNSQVSVSNTYKEVVEATRGEAVSIFEDHKVIYDKIYDNMSKAFLKDRISPVLVENVVSISLGYRGSNREFVEVQTLTDKDYTVEGQVIKFNKFKIDPRVDKMKIVYTVADMTDR